jgi:hypothetical protein
VFFKLVRVKVGLCVTRLVCWRRGDRRGPARARSVTTDDIATCRPAC